MTSARPGTTLLDVTVSLVVLGVLAALVAPRAGAGLDRRRTRAAAGQVAAAYAVARQAAIARAAPVAVHLDAAAGSVAVVGAEDTLLHRPLAADLGVTLATTRDRSVFSPIGLGWGSANATVVLRRGRAADTVVVSRLGRVRRGGEP